MEITKELIKAILYKRHDFSQEVWIVQELNKLMDIERQIEHFQTQITEIRQQAEAQIQEREMSITRIQDQCPHYVKHLNIGIDENHFVCKLCGKEL